MSIEAVESAKKFLVDAIVEQAQRDSISLTDIEKQMLRFSEVSGSQEDLSAAAEFDAQYNDDEYEAKIAKLFRHAYAHDKRRTGRHLAWKSALEALRDEDFYALVMVDQAGIPRPKPILGPKTFVPLLKLIRPIDVFSGFLILVVLALGVALLSDGFSVARRLPDWFRILLCGVCAYIVWAGGNMYWRKRMRDMFLERARKSAQLLASPDESPKL